jgi:hypothetical protein
MNIPEPLNLSLILALCIYIFTLLYKSYLKVHKKEINPTIIAITTFVLVNSINYYLHIKTNAVIINGAFM